MKLLVAGCLFVGLAGSTLAQGAPTVEVSLSPSVKALEVQLGRSAVDEQRASLQRQVVQAIARHGASVGRVELVIQDIQPNRPTSEELGTSASLNADSFGLGGAAVTGRVVMANGQVLPVRYRYFPPNLQQEINFYTWGDAQETFAVVAEGIAKGDPPDQTGSWPPPHRPRALTGTLLSR